MDTQILDSATTKTTDTLSLEEAKTLGDEYGALMILPTLSDDQERRMDFILHLATIHENVDFWVSQAACNRGAEIGLLSPESLEYYENQRTILREQIDLDVPLEPVAHDILMKQVDQARQQQMVMLNNLSDALTKALPG